MITIRRLFLAITVTTALLTAVAPTAAQHGDHHDQMGHGAEPDRGEEMWMTTLPGGWHLMGMAQIVPSVSFTAPFSEESPLNRTDIRFPHAALMGQLASPGSRWVFKLMPNLEGLTLPDGEPALGGWGEGFIDARHPHTLLHEAMLSYNWWSAPGGALSVSAGRGFAPYGTDDPMYRPALKYPTNHHLSQVLERWVASVAWATDAGFGLELGVFDGDEPDGPWDVSNIGNFGNSWSGRVSYRIGEERQGVAPWEVSASHAQVRESHGHEGIVELTRLYNAAVRHDAVYGFGDLYGLAEASMSDPEDGDGYFSVLGEAQLGLGSRSAHRPFYRIEYATRPEYPRDGAEGDPFFRYDHDDHAIGATRWLINTVGYGVDVTPLPLSARPFIEVSHNRVAHERGPASLEPEALFGGDSFFTLVAGVRIFLGGGPMRMGAYGVTDAMTRAMRGPDMTQDPPAMDHEGHH